MGQEEEIRISKHRGWKWQVLGTIHNQLNHFHSINIIKGESTMKARKKIACIILVVLLASVMALPVFADSTTESGRDGDCFYSMYTICNPYDYSTYMEFQGLAPGSSMTYNDFLFKSNVHVYEYGDFWQPAEFDFVYGSNSARMSVNSKSYNYAEHTLCQVKADHYVNNDYTMYTIATFNSQK